MFTYRPTTKHDAEFIYNLRNDPTTYINLHDPSIYSVHSIKKWLKRLPASSQRITVEKEYTPIGLIRVDNIGQINKNCSIGLDLIKECRGRGWSKLIYGWIFDYWFNQQNMNCLWLEVLETNQIAINLYKTLGFQIDGRLRERVYRNNQYIDSIMMSLLKNEWRKTV